MSPKQRLMELRQMAENIHLAATPAIAAQECLLGLFDLLADSAPSDEKKPTAKKKAAPKKAAADRQVKPDVPEGKED